MSSLTFEDILVCRPEMMDPAQGGLWWCESAEDVAAWPVNSVCLSISAQWKNVQSCKDWQSVKEPTVKRKQTVVFFLKRVRKMRKRIKTVSFSNSMWPTFSDSLQQTSASPSW